VKRIDGDRGERQCEETMMVLAHRRTEAQTDSGEWRWDARPPWHSPRVALVQYIRHQTRDPDPSTG
jgi:hypothetical protein